MSSPGSVGANSVSGTVPVREGTRVILREITANLHNSSPVQSPKQKNGNEGSTIKGEHQHDVKVRFIREFADASGGTTVRDVNAESSLSSASSFQSLTSTLSSKCSSGICVDSNPGKGLDASYTNNDIPGLDDLITACGNIHLDETVGTEHLAKDHPGVITGLEIDFDETVITEHLAKEHERFIRSLMVDGDEIVATENLKKDHRSFVTGLQIDFDETVGTEDFAKEHRDFIRSLQIDEAFSGDQTFVSATDEISLDRTRDISRENSPVHNHADVTQNLDINGTFDGKTNIADASATIDNFEGSIVNVVETSISSQDNLGIVSVNETFVQCTSDGDLAQQTQSNIVVVAVDGSEPRLSIVGEETVAKTENSTEAPVNESDNVPVQLDTNENQQEIIIPSIPSICEFVDNSQDPTLPTLSSIVLRAEENENNVQPIEDSNANDIKTVVTEKSPDSPTKVSEDIIPEVIKVAPSLSEKFDNIIANDIAPGNSISTIKEPTFLNIEKLDDESLQICDEKLFEKPEEAVPHVEDNLEEKSRCRALEIDKDVELNVKEFIRETSDAKERQRVDEKLPTSLPVIENKEIPSELREVETKSEILNVEKETEILSDIVDEEADLKCLNDSNDLDETVTVQDISDENIFAVPESDQYAAFVPQQQSTELGQVNQRLNLNETNLVSGVRSFGIDNRVEYPISLPNEYEAFRPQQQSTSLANSINFKTAVDHHVPLEKLQRQQTPFVTAFSDPFNDPFNQENRTSPKPKVFDDDDRCNFDKLELAANSVANDIYSTSLELMEENTNFVSATSELFRDPTNFDFLLSKTPRKNTARDLRSESLYVKFDPLLSNTSMLPQSNNTTPPANEERNGEENNTTVLVTPKRNPAIAAIDRLLFYSPMSSTGTATTAAIQKTNDTQEKMAPIEETSEETVNMAKELELVRSTVLQLEEQYAKLKIDHEEALEKQASYQEKINQLQAQLSQEIKNKNQITVVVDEYEKSISRLVAERERDRKNLDVEKSKLQEELQASKHHLDNTEAAFNDVHRKYERLKGVVATYKNNEAALKESLQENVEIIKTLENRYEQVKSHATARLEKANQDLDAIRKQNESETVRLHAMLRKAELKSNSLAELVEQKTKENKELAQILDEVIARVGRKQPE